MNRLECQSIYDSLQGIFYNHARACLTTSEHQTVFLKYQNLADIGTLPLCCEMTHKYLRLQDGDIVLTNDPYTGGTLLSSPTLIMGVGNKTSKGVDPAELLIASRLTLPPKIGAFKTVDEEGLRIPPSPFYIKGELNTPLIEALKNHPHTQTGYIEALIIEAEHLLALRKRLKPQITLGSRFDFSKTRLREYLDATEKVFHTRLEEIGDGTAMAEVHVSAAQILRLKVEHRNGHFDFDFTGTSSGENLFLTSSATIGVAIGVTTSLLRLNAPINSGLFKHFDMKTQRGSLLNSTFPQSLLLGHTDGLNIVANLVSQALGKLHKKHAWAASGASNCYFQIKCTDGRTLTDYLPCGMGANETGVGLSGVFLWDLNANSPSIEKWEREYPFQILNSGFRGQSAGEGRHLGGFGVTRSLKFLEDVELSWNFLSLMHNPLGLYGGKSALGPEMIWQNTEGKKQELSSSGLLKIKKGETLTVLSPGGGGYGLKAQ